MNSAKAELADQMREQQREMEGILDNIRALKREIQLADLVLDSYIPKEYQVWLFSYTKHLLYLASTVAATNLMASSHIARI